MAKKKRKKVNVFQNLNSGPLVWNVWILTIVLGKKTFIQEAIKYFSCISNLLGNMQIR